ncbi:MAG: hypothetical protein AAFV53_33040, partial [Myxococcota bacterium]
MSVDTELGVGLGLRLQIPPAAWGRLASICRTLEWVAVDLDRMELAVFLGTNCGRLMDEALTLIGDASEEVEQPLRRARALLAGLDARPPHQQRNIVQSLRELLQEVIPLSQLGAPLPNLPPVAQLVAPDKPDPAPPSSDDSPSEGPSAGAAVDGGDVSAPQKSTGTATKESKAASSAESPTSPPEPLPSESSEPSESLPSEPLPPELVPLGHEEATGLPVDTLDGVDEMLADRLGEVGIHTIADLMMRPPATHERVPLNAIRPGMEEGMFTVRSTIRSCCIRLSPFSRRWEVVLNGVDGAVLVCRWISSAPRGWETWNHDDQIGLIGQIELTEDGPVMYEAEPVGIDGRGSGLLPMYGLPGLDDAQLREIIAEALRDHTDRLLDPLPTPVLERYRLQPLSEALRDAHFPANNTGRGRLRLAFEELLLLQLGIIWRSGRGQPERGISHDISHKGVAQISAQHQVFLDNGQEAAFSQIRRDLVRPEPMTRLLQGDVGTGKGLVTLMSAAMVGESKLQVAMVGPDPLAVERRYLFAEGMLRSIGLVPLMVTEQLSHGQADAIRRGEAHVVFGTQRILANDVHWRRLGLVIVEERGELGTVMPQQLARSKGPRPDLLVTTAAPIPSSLAFTVFGEFDVSIVPATRQLRADGHIYDAPQRREAYAAALAHLEAGRQAFVVLPVRNGRDLLDPSDALNMAKALQAEAFPNQRIGIYCSPMSREERFRVFEDFQHRRIDILVCTTYIEDAPPLDNATVMIVEYADLHDMVRLHRLRGHIGRGIRPGQGLYILSDTPEDKARSLVEQVIHEQNGFRLAELDLQARGSRALLGERADELPDFNWADPPRDRQQLLRARAEAFNLIRLNPTLRRWPALVNAIRQRWGDWFGDTLPAAGKSRSSG